ncbi:MAG: hypothetical protein LBQ83_01745 [Candidatus Margulisbacteria bacterium]|jgi:hypothetical protein|nr:hypothetical protein [Candidatus Margulisiibacteriota bacterium]
MAKQQKPRQQDSGERVYSSGGGGMGPVGSVGLGMSSVERVQYIQELQRASPVQKIAGAIKEVKWEGFGLLGDIFNKGAAVMRGVSDAYTQIRQSRGDAAINQHIAGLTENVRGLERLRHELEPQANTALPGAPEQTDNNSFYIDPDWVPRPRGRVE